MIYVTVGTMFMDFGRLVRAMDAVAEKTGERVVIQIGLGTTRPAHAESFDFKPREEVLAIQREARLVVAHAGIGCVLDALDLEKPLLVVPRRADLQEHMDDHQRDIAQAVERRGWGKWVRDVAELDALCADPPPPPRRGRPSAHRLVDGLRDMIDRIAADRSGP